MIYLSPLVKDILSDWFAFKLESPYYLNLGSVARHVPYFLADSRYPSWWIFGKTIHGADNIGEEMYSKR